MNIFLFLKQFVDMLYQWKALDYGMTMFSVVLFAVGLYRFVQTQKELSTAAQQVEYRERSKPDFRARMTWFFRILLSSFCLTDYIIILLAILITTAFLRNPAGYANFFKIQSAFLLYFLGRLYVLQKDKAYKALAIAAYIVVYLNLVISLLGLGYLTWAGEARTFAGMYYFKTDLAAAMVIAAVFIFFYSKIKILKYLTIFGTCPYLVFISNSRAFLVILCLIYCMFALYLYEKKRGKAIRISWKLVCVLAAALICAIVGIALLTKTPLFQKNAWIGFELSLENGFLDSYNAQSRNIIWAGIMDYFNAQPFTTRFFGIDLISETLHNEIGYPSHSLYIRLLYATGYLGCAVFAFMILQVLRHLKKLDDMQDRVLFYVTASLWLIFLVEGFAYATIDSTQYSWFTFLFTGVTVSMYNSKTIPYGLWSLSEISCNQSE